ncbi:hypothetical protein BsWGS_20953 [Bradybaena similaris]
MTDQEALCRSYLRALRINEAWHLTNEIIMTDINLVSDNIVDVLISLLGKHELFFIQTGALNQLQELMAVLLKQPRFDDISALGTLIYWETKNTAFSQAKVDSERLMDKAIHCLEIWTHWYHSVGGEILKMESKLRTKLSLTLLRKVADIAIVNFQNFTAVKSLCKAYFLANKMKQSDIAKNVTQSIVTVIPQLGLQCVLTRCDKGTVNEDIFIGSMGLGRDGDLLSLTAIATHHLKTGQLKEFLIVRDVFYKHVPLSRPRSRSVADFAKAIIKRLEAEFLMIPESRALQQEAAGCTKPLQNALELARSSYQIITGLFASQHGNNFPRGITHGNSGYFSSGNTVWPWQFIHELLCITKLIGELSVHTGFFKNAKSYFLYGLEIVDRFKLASWGAIFTSFLVEHELLAENLNAAIPMLQRAQSFIRRRTSSLTPGFQRCHRKPSIDIVHSNKLTCGLKMSHLEREHAHFSRLHKHACNREPNSDISDSQCSRESGSYSSTPSVNAAQPIQSKDCMAASSECNTSDMRQHILFNLIRQPENDKCLQKNGDSNQSYLVLNNITSCCRCCQSEIICICIHVMCLQAKILRRKQNSICAFSSMLETSLYMAEQFVRIPLCAELQDLMRDSGWSLCDLSLNTSHRILSETAFTCAEMYFQNLYLMGAEAPVSCDHVEPDISKVWSLLDIAESVGKTVGGLHMCNVIVASSLLLRSNLNNLDVLKTLSNDDFQEAEKDSDSKSASSVYSIITAALVTAMGEQLWKEKKSQLLSLFFQSDLLHKKPKTSQQTDLTSNQTISETSISSSDHKADIIDNSSSLESHLLSETESEISDIPDRNTVLESNEKSHTYNNTRHSHSTSSCCARHMQSSSSCCELTQNVPEAEERSSLGYIDRDGQVFVQCREENVKLAWFHKLTFNFPALKACQNLTQRISCLQTALREFCEMPHYLLYRRISQSLALCLWKQMSYAWNSNQTSTAQVEIAAHLTNSMHLTFQHMMSQNFCHKLSKKRMWRIYTPCEAHLNQTAMKDALAMLKFGGDIMENFRWRLAAVPADWTVVQITMVNFDPTNPGTGQIFVTRLNRDRQPITIGLPRNRCQFLKIAQRAYAVVNEETNNECFCEKGSTLMDAQFYLQDVVLSGHKWLLRGQLDFVRDIPVQKFLDEMSKRAVDLIFLKHGYRICHTQLRNLLEVFLEASEADILSVVELMWPPHVTDSLTRIFLDVQKEMVRMCGGQRPDKRGPVILILDNEFTGLPWENIPDLLSDTVTRMPSLASLVAVLKWHLKMKTSGFTSGVERAFVAANLALPDPQIEAYEQLLKGLRRCKGWRIQVDSSAIHRSAQMFEPVLRNSSLYLYYGHSWDDYSFLQNIFASACALLMSCDSGSLSVFRNLDGDGAPLYFLMAGCPAVLGHLWSVCAKDASRMLLQLSSSWMSHGYPFSIRELVVPAIKATRFYGYSGAGMVIYGLPLMMN